MKHKNEPKKDALVALPDETDVAVPKEFEQYIGAGMEGMTRDDMKMPRLALAQGLSPQLNPDEPLYIDGLKLGDAFNSLTGEIYGRGPWEIAVVRRDPPRWVEFIPRDEGGGVKDLNVPRKDPRCEWRTVTDEKTGQSVRLPPIATQFYDYIVVFLATREIIAVSCKSTAIRMTAQPWNSLLMQRTQVKPMFMGKYALRSVMTKNAKGSFAALLVANAGWVQDPDEIQFLGKTFLAFKDKVVEIDRDHVREPGEDDDM